MMVSEEQDVYNLQSLRAKKALVKNDLLQTEMELSDSLRELFSLDTIKQSLFGNLFSSKSSATGGTKHSNGLMGWITTIARLGIYGVAGTKKGLKGFLAVNAASAIDRYILPHIGTMKDYISGLTKIFSKKSSPNDRYQQ